MVKGTKYLWAAWTAFGLLMLFDDLAKIPGLIVVTTGAAMLFQGWVSPISCLAYRTIDPGEEIF